MHTADLQTRFRQRPAVPLQAQTNPITTRCICCHSNGAPRQHCKQFLAYVNHVCKCHWHQQIIQSSASIMTVIQGGSTMIAGIAHTCNDGVDEVLKGRCDGGLGSQGAGEGSAGSHCKGCGHSQSLLSLLSAAAQLKHFRNGCGTEISHLPHPCCIQSSM